LTAEQLEASRSERMRLNGIGTLTLEDARTWLEETGLCLFLPRRQSSAFVAPTFVEAVAGERIQSASAKTVAQAEDLLVRLEASNVAVRLNLLGQPTEQPDFVVASWVLPYVYALRGDRDWRRSPQLTGSRAVSPLAIQAYKILEAGDATIPQLRHALAREVTESAVLRAIAELWQQLRIIPVVSAPGKTAQWQPLRLRYQKAIAEGASTSQVTAISVLASIYLQAVIAATMEDVELFLAALTARSKVREVLRGLVATRQVHTIAFGPAAHFYVAGTLPDFPAPPTVYASSAMPASTNFLRSYEYEDVAHGAASAGPRAEAASTSASQALAAPANPASVPSSPASRIAPDRPDQSKQKAPVARPHLSRQPAHARSRKPVQSAPSRHSARPAAPRASSGSRHPSHPSSVRRSRGSAQNVHPGRAGAHSKNNSARPGRFAANGASRANGPRELRKANLSNTRSLRNGHGTTKGTQKTATMRSGVSRKNARASQSNRKPALAASARPGSRSRYGFTAPSRRRTKKRG